MMHIGMCFFSVCLSTTCKIINIHRHTEGHPDKRGRFTHTEKQIYTYSILVYDLLSFTPSLSVHLSCMCTHTHIHTHTCMHAHTHTHTQTHTRVHPPPPPPPHTHTSGLTVKIASSFMRDLSSFSSGCSNLFSLDSTRKPCKTNTQPIKAKTTHTMK